MSREEICEQIASTGVPKVAGDFTEADRVRRPEEGEPEKSESPFAQAMRKAAGIADADVGCPCSNCNCC